jgi:hypothetical protein
VRVQLGAWVALLFQHSTTLAGIAQLLHVTDVDYLLRDEPALFTAQLLTPRCRFAPVCCRSHLPAWRMMTWQRHAPLPQHARCAEGRSCSAVIMRMNE